MPAERSPAALTTPPTRLLLYPLRQTPYSCRTDDDPHLCLLLVPLETHHPQRAPIPQGPKPDPPSPALPTSPTHCRLRALDRHASLSVRLAHRNPRNALDTRVPRVEKDPAELWGATMERWNGGTVPPGERP